LEIGKFGNKTNLKRKKLILSQNGLLKEIIENICLESNFEDFEGDKSAMVGNRT